MKTRGFTLIELSIALVIIGLITAGILAGRELSHNAQLRATISQFREYDAAVNSFKIKYNCLPGDCPYAESLGLGVHLDWGENGNGNGRIDGNEYSSFWYHLQQAGPLNTPNIMSFVSPRTLPMKIGSQTPYTIAEFTTPGNSTRGSRGGWTVVGGEDMITSMYQGPPHYFAILAGTYFLILNQANTVLPIDAYYMDSKIDDGYPLSGTVTARGFVSIDRLWTPYMGAGGASSNVCVANDVTPNTYNVANTTPVAGSVVVTTGSLCSMLFRTDF